jgi:segregation and condensation protein B
MSLKAKLEAVIYAAEEPVTLAQLSALFATDALEWKAAQEAASAVTATGQAEEGSEPLPMLDAAFDYLELESATEAPAETAEAQIETAQELALESAPESAEEAGADTSAEAGVEGAGEAGGETKSEAPADPEADSKRLARLRDREVRTILRGLLDELIANYASDDRGIEIKEIAGGYRMATKPECHDAARMFVKSLKPAMKLSLPALETLAVIAYKQPVTAPEVNEIRGVDSSGVFGSLLARKLIATAGRKQVIGRPILYKTTKEFLLRFGLKDVAELPSMEEFEKMAELEFEEAEAGGEGETALAFSEDLSLEVDEFDDEPEEESEGTAAHENQEGIGTAAMADSETTPANRAQDSRARDNRAHDSQEPETTEHAGCIPAMEAERAAAEAAPAAPSPLPEQAETETVPHD